MTIRLSKKKNGYIIPLDRRLINISLNGSFRLHCSAAMRTPMHERVSKRVKNTIWPLGIGMMCVCVCDLSKRRKLNIYFSLPPHPKVICALTLFTCSLHIHILDFLHQCFGWGFSSSLFFRRFLFLFLLLIMNASPIPMIYFECNLSTCWTMRRIETLQRFVSFKCHKMSEIERKIPQTLKPGHSMININLPLPLSKYLTCNLQSWYNH